MVRDDPVSEGELTNKHDLYYDGRVTTIPLRGSPEVVLVEQLVTVALVATFLNKR